jgi:hypothetical protein
MARHPTSEGILSRTELADFTRHLMKLDQHGIEKLYEGAWHDSRMQDGRIPTAVAI